MTAEEKRAKVATQAEPIIGRNNYSQDSVRRECVFVKYKDGKYYSDCSSSVRKMYERASIGLNNIGGNTVGIYLNKAAVAVNCAIKNGVPTDISALRVGDLLLYAGTDSSRAYAGYVGHVEMVYAIKGGKVTLFGHGGGHPKTHDMVSYCRSRQAAETKTARGNKGLIKVVRFIADDVADNPEDDANPTTRTSLSVGMKNNDVRTMQQALLAQGYELPGWGADGQYGEETQKAVAAFQKDRGLPVTGQADEVTLSRILAQETAPGAGEVLVIASVTANVRKGPGTNSKSLGTVKRDEKLTRTGDDSEGWFGVRYKDQDAWISARMAEVVG
jgi:hypothetical protein